MRAVDLRCPWGRSAEDVVSRKRDFKEQQLHRTRLAAVKSVVDCASPSTVGMPHLKYRAKKKQNRDEREHKIASENKILMAKIMSIMRDGSSGSMATLTPTTDLLRANLEVMNESHHRKRHSEIASENRVLARRLRTLEPNYVRARHLADYERSLVYVKTISRAHQLQQRLAASTSSVPSLFRPGDSTLTLQTGVDLDGSVLKTPGLELRTAKQVRADSASAHGYDVGPDPARSLALTAGSSGADVDYNARLRE